MQQNLSSGFNISLMFPYVLDRKHSINDYLFATEHNKTLFTQILFTELKMSHCSVSWALVSEYYIIPLFSKTSVSTKDFGRYWYSKTIRFSTHSIRTTYNKVVPFFDIVCPFCIITIIIIILLLLICFSFTVCFTV